MESHAAIECYDSVLYGEGGHGHEPQKHNRQTLCNTR